MQSARALFSELPAAQDELSIVISPSQATRDTICPHRTFGLVEENNYPSSSLYMQSPRIGKHTRMSVIISH